MLGVQPGIQYYISISDLLVENAYSISLLPAPSLILASSRFQQAGIYNNQGATMPQARKRKSSDQNQHFQNHQITINIINNDLMNLFQRGIFFRICSASQFGSVSCRAFFSSFSFCTLIQDNMESMKEGGQGSMMNRIDRIYLQLVFNCLTLFKRALPSIDILRASPITLV